MTTTYSSTLTTLKDQVRFEIGDVANFQLQDEEIAVKLTAYNNNVLMAASECARALAARHAGEVDRIVGQANVREGDREKHYLDLADALYDRAARQGAVAYLGGQGADDKASRSDDITYVQPRFKREWP